MIIGVTGYGATGASALVDLIREFEGMQGYKAAFEFQIIQEPDGIIDLKYNLVKAGRRLNNQVAIKRFLKNIRNTRNVGLNKASSNHYEKLAYEYVNKLADVTWGGHSGFDPQDIKSFFDKKSTRYIKKIFNAFVSRIHPDAAFPPNKKRYFSSLTEEEFDAVTSEFINSLLAECGMDVSKPIILEQVFNTTNPLEGAEYFDSAKSIIIDRDARDVFVITNDFLRRLSGYMPNKGSAEDFVKYYKKIHAPRVDNPNILYIQYEDLIYNYDSSIVILENFLGLKHVDKGSCFKPECSINNTQMYKMYPQHAEAIKYIEENIPEYTYNFENNREISFVPQVGKPFHIQKR